MKDCENVVRVIEIPSVRPGQFLHAYLDPTDQKGIGFFGPQWEKEGTVPLTEEGKYGSDLQRDTTFR